jgi:hypothetical protein
VIAEGAMPKFRTPEPPTAPRFRPAAEPPTRRLQPLPQAQAQPGSAAPAKAPDLTVNKVIAGAGAAATSAILGSYFGAAGTVTGAALGSVASTVASVIYQRSLDRTRDTLVARIRVTPGRRPDIAQPVGAEPAVRLPAPRVAPDAETVRLRVEPDVRPRHRRRTWAWLGATVLVFAIGLLAVTGVEWAKGSSITTGETGTSVGRVITGHGDRAAPTEEQAPTEAPKESRSPDPTTDPTAEPNPSESSDSGATQTPDPSGVPGSGTDEGGQNRNDRSRDGATTPAPTPLLPIFPGQ